MEVTVICDIDGVALVVVGLVGVVLIMVGVGHGISPHFSVSIFVPLHEFPCKHILFLSRTPPSQEKLQAVHSLQLDHTVYKNTCNYKIISKKARIVKQMVKCCSLPGHGLIGLAGHQQVQLTPKKPSEGHSGGSSQPSEDKHINCDNI